jgi:ferredoxin--NADP+ reductase
MDGVLNATVTLRSEINHGLLVLRVTSDEELPPFKPGQYVVLGLPGSASRSCHADAEGTLPDPGKMIIRAYSIASSSLDEQYLEFYIALVRSGALTPRLFALQPGNRLWLGRKIVGMFTLEDAPDDNHLLFFATGTGLAPYLSMLRSAYEFNADRMTVVCHAARVSWDLGYRGELEGLAARYPNFHYLPIIDEVDRDPEWHGQVGFVNRLIEEGTIATLLGHDIDPCNTSVFLCGNPLMVDSMMTSLAELGFTKHTRRKPGAIFVEEYWKQ